MKLFFVVIIYIFLNHCSFDDKTGIWKSNNNISKKEKNLSHFKAGWGGDLKPYMKAQKEFYYD